MKFEPYSNQTIMETLSDADGVSIEEWSEDAQRTIAKLAGPLLLKEQIGILSGVAERYSGGMFLAYAWGKRLHDPKKSTATELTSGNIIALSKTALFAMDLANKHQESVGDTWVTDLFNHIVRVGTNPTTELSAAKFELELFMTSVEEESPIRALKVMGGLNMLLDCLDRDEAKTYSSGSVMLANMIWEQAHKKPDSIPDTLATLEELLEKGAFAGKEVYLATSGVLLTSLPIFSEDPADEERRQTKQDFWEKMFIDSIEGGKPHKQIEAISQVQAALTGEGIVLPKSLQEQALKMKNAIAVKEAAPTPATPITTPEETTKTSAKLGAKKSTTKATRKSRKNIKTPATEVGASPTDGPTQA